MENMSFFVYLFLKKHNFKIKHSRNELAKLNRPNANFGIYCSLAFLLSNIHAGDFLGGCQSFDSCLIDTESLP